MHAAQPVSGLPGAPAAWQNPQVGPIYPGNDFAAGGAAPPHFSGGQIAPWDPSMQAGRTPFVSGSSTYPGQTFAAPGLVYATEAVPVGSSPLTPASHPVTSMGFSPAVPMNVRPGDASPPVQHTYYGQ